MTHGLTGLVMRGLVCVVHIELEGGLGRGRGANNGVLGPLRLENCKASSRLARSQARRVKVQLSKFHPAKDTPVADTELAC